MRTATFWATHEPSDSRALFEFGLIKKRVQLTCIFFVRGNVVDLNSFRECKQHAKELLA